MLGKTFVIRANIPISNCEYLANSPDPRSVDSATENRLIVGVRSYVVYGQKPGHSNQQLHDDDSDFGTNTAHPAQPRIPQDEDTLGSGSPQEPPHRPEEGRPDSDSVAQPEAQQSETLLNPEATQRPQEPVHKNLSSSRNALQPESGDYRDQDMTGSSDLNEPKHRPGEGFPYPSDAQLTQELEHRDHSSSNSTEQTLPQQQQDLHMFGSNSDRDLSHQQDERLFVSHSVQQSHAQQDKGLLGSGDTKRSQQHLYEGSFSSSEG